MLQEAIGILVKKKLVPLIEADMSDSMDQGTKLSIARRRADELLAAPGNLTVFPCASCQGKTVCFVSPGKSGGGQTIPVQSCHVCGSCGAVEGYVLELVSIEKGGRETLFRCSLCEREVAI